MAQHRPDDITTDELHARALQAALDPETPANVSLGEVYRLVQRVDRNVVRVRSKLDDHVDATGDLPRRVESLESGRTWLTRAVGLLTLTAIFMGAGVAI